MTKIRLRGAKLCERLGTCGIEDIHGASVRMKGIVCPTFGPQNLPRLPMPSVFRIGRVGLLRRAQCLLREVEGFFVSVFPLIQTSPAAERVGECTGVAHAFTQSNRCCDCLVRVKQTFASVPSICRRELFVGLCKVDQDERLLTRRGKRLDPSRGTGQQLSPGDEVVGIERGPGPIGERLGFVDRLTRACSQFGGLPIGVDRGFERPDCGEVIPVVVQ